MANHRRASAEASHLDQTPRQCCKQPQIAATTEKTTTYAIACSLLATISAVSYRLECSTCLPSWQFLAANVWIVIPRGPESMCPAEVPV
jgi:hypothetical protein